MTSAQVFSGEQRSAYPAPVDAMVVDLATREVHHLNQVQLITVRGLARVGSSWRRSVRYCP